MQQPNYVDHLITSVVLTCKYLQTDLALNPYLKTTIVTVWEKKQKTKKPILNIKPSEGRAKCWMAEIQVRLMSCGPIVYLTVMCD